jgi:hypothetical protein
MISKSLLCVIAIVSKGFVDFGWHVVAGVAHLFEFDIEAIEDEDGADSFHQNGEDEGADHYRSEDGDYH